MLYGQLFGSAPASAITGGVIKDPLNGNALRLRTTSFRPSAHLSDRRQASAILSGLEPGRPRQLNYSVPVPTTIGNDQTVDRIDQNIGDRIRLFVRAHYQNENVFAGNAIPANASTVPVTTSNYTFGYTHTLTPNLVNDFRVGRNRLDTDNLNYFTVNGLKTAGTDLGITGFNGDTRFNNPGIPEFNITGFNGLGNSGSDWYQADSTYQFSEQLSWSHGAHQIMAGVELRRLATAREATNSPRGQFTFNGTLERISLRRISFLGCRRSLLRLPDRKCADTWRSGATDSSFRTSGRSSRKLTLNYGIHRSL